jgi:aminoglycoside 6-adenylyltransferase
MESSFIMGKMRSEQEMLDLILSTAQGDDRIRAVVLNGSRANPNVKPDRFQDFDIIYLVTEMAPYVDDPTWIDRFGERMILQTPSLMADPAPEDTLGFTYLMQFLDGNRIDLSLIPVDRFSELPVDSLNLVLLDKDGRLDDIPPSSEDAYLPVPPTAKDFDDCCNEFWWVATYVAKGLARDEILFAKRMVEIMRDQLMKMLTWDFGIKTGFRRNTGKVGKHFQETLSTSDWDLLLATYASAEKRATWHSLFNMCSLFRDRAHYVAQFFQFKFPEEDDARVYAYLRYLHEGTIDDL